jgi:transposase
MWFCAPRWRRDKRNDRTGRIGSKVVVVMRQPLRITKVHWRQKARLERLYREALCPRFRTRIQMVLLSMAGRTLNEIAGIVRESDETVRRWLHRFMSEGCDGLIERVHAGRPAQVTSEIECFLLTCIDREPRALGKDRAAWTTALLAEVVEAHFGVVVTDECIRQHLDRIEIVCRRPTWSVKHLAEQQPGYAQKKPRLPGCCAIHRAVQTCMCRMKLR